MQIGQVQEGKAGAKRLATDAETLLGVITLGTMYRRDSPYGRFWRSEAGKAAHPMVEPWVRQRSAQVAGSKGN